MFHVINHCAATVVDWILSAANCGCGAGCNYLRARGPQSAAVPQIAAPQPVTAALESQELLFSIRGTFGYWKLNFNGLTEPIIK